MKYLKSNLVVASILGIGLISSATLYAQHDTQTGTMHSGTNQSSMRVGQGMGQGGMMSGGMMGGRMGMHGRCKEMMGHNGMHTVSNTSADGTAPTTGTTPGS